MGGFSLDETLDRFEQRARRKLARSTRRIRAEYERLSKAQADDDEWNPTGGLKPSLDDYDGHIETHGQD